MRNQDREVFNRLFLRLPDRHRVRRRSCLETDREEEKLRLRFLVSEQTLRQGMAYSSN